MKKAQAGLVLGWLLLVAVSFVTTISSTSSAFAATNCRQVMRDLQTQLFILRPNPTVVPTAQDISKAQALTAAKIVAYPECTPDFDVLAQWNSGVDPSAPFPFAESGDPRTYPLGPISWWWDVIYISLFGKNVILMVLFGWEIFVGGVWAVLAIPLTLLTAILPAAGKIVSWPFKMLRRNNETD